jgi:hypothetical protein
MQIKKIINQMHYTEVEIITNTFRIIEKFQKNSTILNLQSNQKSIMTEEYIRKDKDYSKRMIIKIKTMEEI